ncbi:hypothetical protein GCM10028800_09300 [Nesterenkonia populi]
MARSFDRPTTYSESRLATASRRTDDCLPIAGVLVGGFWQAMQLWLDELRRAAAE